jgi:nucleoside-diphosphate-sugar epimerase
MRDTVLVTGSSGKLGAALAARLATAYQVVGFDHNPPPSPHAGAEHVAVDFRSDDGVRAGLEELRHKHGERLASVIHLADYHDCSGEPSGRYEEVNVRGTERLLRGLAGFRVGQFALGSTILVHRPTRPGHFLKEGAPLGPRWAYPESKLRAEEVVRALHGGIPYVLVRLAAVYDDCCHYPPLAQQVQRILERKVASHIFPGDMSHGRAYVHAEDVVDVFERLVERRAQLPPELALLVGEPHPVSYRELQRTLGRLIHHEEWETREVSKGLARMGAWLQDHLPFVEDPPWKPRMIHQADDHYALDIGRAYHLLEWEPKHSLKDTLPVMIQKLQANPRGWYDANGLTAPANLNGTAEPIGVTSSIS